MEKRRNCYLGASSPLFHSIFNIYIYIYIYIYITSGVISYIILWNVVWCGSTLAACDLSRKVNNMCVVVIADVWSGSTLFPKVPGLGHHAAMIARLGKAEVLGNISLSIQYLHIWLRCSVLYKVCLFVFLFFCFFLLLFFFITSASLCNEDRMFTRNI